MSRRIVLQPPLKDKHGAYLPSDPVPTPKAKPTTRSLSLGEILDRQILVLERAALDLLRESSGEKALSKDQIQSLATCIKITMELKVKENELLDNISDEQLKALADADNE